MTDQNPWYLAERAEQFAIMLLTRLDGVQVSRMAEDHGVDLLVSIDPQRHQADFSALQLRRPESSARLSTPMA